MKSKPVASRSSSVLGGSKREGRIPGRRPGQPGTVRSLAAAPNTAPRLAERVVTGGRAVALTKRSRDRAEQRAGYRRIASPSSPPRRATSASFFFITSKTRSRCDQSSFC
jgi:hypothetical protein